MSWSFKNKFTFDFNLLPFSTNFFSDKGNSDLGVDSLTEEVNDIYLRKIEFCSEKFSKFMLSGAVRDIFQELDSFSHTNKVNSS